MKTSSSQLLFNFSPIIAPSYFLVDSSIGSKESLFVKLFYGLSVLGIDDFISSISEKDYFKNSSADFLISALFVCFIY